MTTAPPVYLYQFGTTTIPTNLGRFTWPAQSRNTNVKTLGGTFDAAGSDVAAPELPYPLAYSAASVHATDTTAIKTALDSLRARAGALDRLWLHTADGYDRWAWARLVNAAPDMSVTERGVVRFNLAFLVRSRWRGSAHGGSWTFDSTYLFDNGLYFDTDGAVVLNDSPGSGQAITVTNGGNVAVDDCGLTITAHTAPITALKIGVVDVYSSPVSEITFTGTIATDTALVIDCGSKTVLNNGVDAFSGLARTAAHVVEPWLRLASGANTVTVTTTGGGTDSTIQFSFSDGWA